MGQEMPRTERPLSPVQVTEVVNRTEHYPSGVIDTPAEIERRTALTHERSSATKGLPREWLKPEWVVRFSMSDGNLTTNVIDTLDLFNWVREHHYVDLTNMQYCTALRILVGSEYGVASRLPSSLNTLLDAHISKLNDRNQFDKFDNISDSDTGFGSEGADMRVEEEEHVGELMEIRDANPRRLVTALRQSIGKYKSSRHAARAARRKRARVELAHYNNDMESFNDNRGIVTINKDGERYCADSDPVLMYDHLTVGEPAAISPASSYLRTLGQSPPHNNNGNNNHDNNNMMSTASYAIPLVPQFVQLSSVIYQPNSVYVPVCDVNLSLSEMHPMIQQQQQQHNHIQASMCPPWNVYYAPQQQIQHPFQFQLQQPQQTLQQMQYHNQQQQQQQQYHNQQQQQQQYQQHQQYQQTQQYQQPNQQYQMQQYQQYMLQQQYMQQQQQQQQCQQAPQYQTPQYQQAPQYQQENAMIQNAVTHTAVQGSWVGAGDCARSEVSTSAPSEAGSVADFPFVLQSPYSDYVLETASTTSRTLPSQQTTKTTTRALGCTESGEPIGTALGIAA